MGFNSEKIDCNYWRKQAGAGLIGVLKGLLVMKYLLSLFMISAFDAEEARGQNRDESGHLLPFVAEQEVYSKNGVDFVVSSLPSEINRESILSEFKKLSSEEQVLFLKKRKEWMDWAFAKVTHKAILSKIIEKIPAPTVKDWLEESWMLRDGGHFDKEKIRAKRLEPLITSTLQSVNDYLWNGFKAVVNPAFKGGIISVNLVIGSASMNRLYALGLAFTTLVDRQTGKIHRGLDYEFERMDPSKFNFSPINLGLHVRISGLSSQLATISRVYSMTTATFFQFMSSPSTFAAGFHMGQNFALSPATVGAILAFVSSDPYWLGLAGLTPFFTPLSAAEVIALKGKRVSFIEVLRKFKHGSSPEAVLTKSEAKNQKCANVL